MILFMIQLVEQGQSVLLLDWEDLKENEVTSGPISEGVFPLPESAEREEFSNVSSGL